MYTRTRTHTHTHIRCVCLRVRVRVQSVNVYVYVYVCVYVYAYKYLFVYVCVYVYVYVYERNMYVYAYVYIEVYVYVYVYVYVRTWRPQYNTMHHMMNGITQLESLIYVPWYNHTYDTSHVHVAHSRATWLTRWMGIGKPKIIYGNDLGKRGTEKSQIIGYVEARHAF